MEDKQIELRMDIQPEYHYQGDRRLMEKVFTNVIGNAVAYSPVGAVITVTQKDEVFSVDSIINLTTIGSCGGSKNENEKSYAGSNRYRQIS